MAIKKKPFTPTRLAEERAQDKSKVVPVRLNMDELATLEEDARLLRQEKQSTALKQLAEIGHFVIHRPEMVALIEVVFNNNRKNERLGIGIVDPKFKQM